MGLDWTEGESGNRELKQARQNKAIVMYLYELISPSCENIMSSTNRKCMTYCTDVRGEHSHGHM